MDKAQKELIKTYWHFRKIANDQGGEEIEPWELTPYSLEHVFDPENAVYEMKGETLGRYFEMFPEKAQEHEYVLNTLPTGKILSLVSRYPEYAKRYDMKDVLTNARKYDVSVFAQKQPELVKDMDLSRIFDDEDDFSMVVNILIAEPELEKNFDLTTYAPNGWTVKRLLIKHPQFAKYPNLIEAMDNHDLASVLKEKPELVKVLPLDKMSDYEKRELVKKRPELFSYFKDEITKSFILSDLLLEQPHLWEEMDEKQRAALSDHGIIEVISEHPEYYDRMIKYMDEVNKSDIRDLLVAEPRLWKKLDLSKLDDYEITKMLTANPDIAKYLPQEILDKAEGLWMKDMLAQRPELLKYYDISDWSGYDLRSLLDKNPKLVDKINTTNMSEFDIVSLLEDHPEVIKYFKDRLGEINPWSVKNLLQKHPKLAKWFDNNYKK